jgi:RNA polymerase sigma-70 factor (TIGR02943 family)
MTKTNIASLSTSTHLPKDDVLEDIPENWVNLHGNYLMRFAFLRVNSREIAEDLVQEALLAGVKAFENFEGRSQVRTWLIGILKNKIIDHMRRHARKEGNEIMEEDTETLDRHFNRFGIWNRILPNWADDPETLQNRSEFMRALEGCLRKLPERSRQAFMLKNFENVDSEEVCNILNLTTSNLWVLLHRARLSLRECIEENWIQKA